MTRRRLAVLPRENRVEVLRVLDARLRPELVIGWLYLIKAEPDIEAELAELPSRFAEGYGVGG